MGSRDRQTNMECPECGRQFGRIVNGERCPRCDTDVKATD